MISNIKQRDRDKDRERKTDRQTDRETDRDTEREKQRERERAKPGKAVYIQQRGIPNPLQHLSKEVI